MRKKTMARLTPRQRKLAQLLEGEGNLADFTRKISRVSGKPVSWETVYSWILRGSVPKSMLLHVQKATGARIDQLL